MMLIVYDWKFGTDYCRRINLFIKISIIVDIIDDVNSLRLEVLEQMIEVCIQLHFLNYFDDAFIFLSH